MNYHIPIKQTVRRKKRMLVLLSAVTALLLSIILVVLVPKNKSVQSPVAFTHSAVDAPTPAPSATPAPAAVLSAQSTSLGQAVLDALVGTTGTYAVVVKNLKTGETYATNEHRQYEPASLYKLWVMATVYRQIADGTLTEDQELSQDVQTLNDDFQIASDVAELTEGTITATVADALSKMITVSDNYSALLLSSQTGLSSIAQFLNDNGLRESTVGTDGSDPTTTASDIALFFEKLYNGQLSSPQYTREMITLLKNQALNSKLPKLLADDVVIAHKTGELFSFTHDAGIVYTPDGDYVIVVLSDSDDPPSAANRISLISKNVYNYFTGDGAPESAQ